MPFRETPSYAGSGGGWLAPAPWPRPPSQRSASDINLKGEVQPGFSWAFARSLPYQLLLQRLQERDRDRDGDQQDSGGPATGRGSQSKIR